MEDKSVNDEQTRNRGNSGRGPLKSDAQRKRSNLTLRIRDSTRAALEKRARENGRSLSEETEWLVEQALHSNNLLDQALDLTFGKQVSGLVLLLAVVVRNIEKRQGTFPKRHSRGRFTVFDDASLFDELPQAIVEILNALRPPDAKRKTFSVIESTSEAVTRNAPTKRPWTAGTRSLRLLLSAPEGSAVGEWAATVKRKLGSDIVRRIRIFIAHRQ
jgi:hypothetical protein